MLSGLGWSVFLNEKVKWQEIRMASVYVRVLVEMSELNKTSCYLFANTGRNPYNISQPNHTIRPFIPSTT